MLRENIEIARRGYAAYNDAMQGPDPLSALRAWIEEFLDPQVEWEPIAISPAGLTTFRGLDGVMAYFETLLEAFEELRETAERFIDAGDRVVVFVRAEARFRASAIELDERQARLLTYRDGKVVRLQVFRERAEALEAAGVDE